MKLAILILAVCCLWFISAINVHAETANMPLLLTAVLPNPSLNDLQAEWLQLYNASQQELELKDIQLKQADKLTSLKLEPTTLAAQEHLILAREPESLASIFPYATIKKASFSLPNRPTKLELWYRDEKMNGWEYQNSTADMISFYSLSCQAVITTSLADYDTNLPVVYNCPNKEPVNPAPAPATTKPSIPSEQVSKRQQDKLYQQLVALNQMEIKPAQPVEGKFTKQPEKIYYKSYSPMPIKVQSLGNIVRILALSVTTATLATEAYYWLLKLVDLPVLSKLRGQIRPP